MPGDSPRTDDAIEGAGWKAALGSNLTAAIAEGEPLLSGPATHGPVERVLAAIAWLCMAIAGVMLVALIAIFGWLVSGRYVMNDTPTWVEQVALVLVVWITFLGGAAGVWSGSHLSIDFVREALPMTPRLVLRWLAGIGMVVFGGFMAWQGLDLAQGTWSRMIPMLGIPEGWRAVPMGICGVLTVIFSLAHLARMARGIDPAEV